MMAGVLRDWAHLSAPLDRSTAGLQSTERITSEELTEAFKRAQESLASHRAVTIPQSDDQLFIVTYGAVRNSGQGATIYARRGHKLLLSGVFSARLKKNQSIWLPCEIKAVFNPNLELIIVPQDTVDGITSALHVKLSHPTCYQLKMAAQGCIYVLDLERAMENITQSCHTCASVLKVPRCIEEQSTCDPVSGVSSNGVYDKGLSDDSDPEWYCVPDSQEEEVNHDKESYHREPEIAVIVTPSSSPKVPDIPVEIAEPPSLERDSPVQVTPPSPEVLSEEIIMDGASGMYVDQSPVCSTSEQDNKEEERCSPLRRSTRSREQPDCFRIDR